MIHETIPIHGGTASLVTYIHDRSEQSGFQRHNRPAIIVLPGGGIGARAFQPYRCAQCPARIRRSDRFISVEIRQTALFAAQQYQLHGKP